MILRMTLVLQIALAVFLSTLLVVIPPRVEAVADFNLEQVGSIDTRGAAGLEYIRDEQEHKEYIAASNFFTSSIMERRQPAM